MGGDSQADAEDCIMGNGHHYILLHNAQKRLPQGLGEPTEPLVHWNEMLQTKGVPNA